MTATYEELSELMTRMTGDEKHGASATSTLDVIWVLYHHVLQIDSLDDPGRDRFLVSKGHGPMAYYAVLAAHDLLDVAVLDTFGDFDSPLGYHPDRTLVTGVEISSGSLGHGLPIATGTATALRLQERTSRVVVLVGDAELDEGSNVEAIQYAARAGLGNLIVVVVDNTSAGLGWPGGIASRFEVEGWTSIDVDGRDHGALRTAFASGVDGIPHVVVAHVEQKDS